MYLCGSLWRLASLSLNQHRNYFSLASIADIRTFFFNLVVLHESKFAFSVVLLYLETGVDV